MKPWTSCAKWPSGHIHNPSRIDVTEDGHDTKEQAEAVCRMLERDGFGGEGRVFPVDTWVEDNMPARAVLGILGHGMAHQAVPPYDLSPYLYEGRPIVRMTCEQLLGLKEHHHV